METERYIIELFNARKTNNCLFFNSYDRMDEISFNNGHKSLNNIRYNQNYWTVDKIDQCCNYFNLMDLTCNRWPFQYFLGTANYMVANSYSVLRMLRPVEKEEREDSRGKESCDWLKTSK